MVIWRRGGRCGHLSPFLPRWRCRPVTRFDCHSSTARAPALLPACLPSRPLLVPLPPSFLLGISSAAATGGGGEKKRSVEMRLCARPPRRPLAFWDDNYGSNYNEFVPDSGRGTEGGEARSNVTAPCPPHLLSLWSVNVKSQISSSTSYSSARSHRPRPGTDLRNSRTQTSRTKISA